MIVFITTEILKCEIHSRCPKVINYSFNSNVENTLKFDIPCCRSNYVVKNKNFIFKKY